MDAVVIALAQSREKKKGGEGRKRKIEAGKEKKKRVDSRLVGEVVGGPVDDVVMLMLN